MSIGVRSLDVRALLYTPLPVLSCWSPKACSNENQASLAKVRSTGPR